MHARSRHEREQGGKVIAIMHKRRRLLLSEPEGDNFWPSFTDLTSTIALILFVLVLLAYIQNLISGKNLNHVKAELAAAMERLRGSQEQITASQSRLRLLAAEIEAGQTQLRLSETRVQTQQEVIAQSNRELGELRGKLQGIAVLRLDVLQQVKASLEAQLRAQRGADAPNVSIASNGNLVIDESLLFETNSYTITRAGKSFLSALANACASVLSDQALRENIDTIVVQGHTDERGTVTYNRELSAKRANAVLDYMFSANASLEQSYGSYFASSAYSEFRPVSAEQTEAAYTQDRRIEISVVIKDASVRAMIDEYMRNVSPALTPAP
jgi:chemotaxis protein MotB